MHDLRVIGVENDTLLASGPDGTRYRIPIDEETHTLLRRRARSTTSKRKVAPRDIQAHIRAGMSAQDVADMTGAALEDIERFEGPVLAEREYVVNAALAVPVNTASDTSPLNGATFGTVMDERLTELGAHDSSWASWKDPETGWIVKLAFTTDDVERDARWQFDPKKSALAPLNGDATRLSQQGELSGSLIPRLRAVPVEKAPDTTRFDSGAFSKADLSARDTAPYGDAIPFGRGSQSTGHTTDSPAVSAPEPENTADLLEALRRRRGEREAAPLDEAEEARTSHPSTGSIRVIDIPLDDFNDDAADTVDDSALSGLDGSAPPSLFTAREVPKVPERPTTATRSSHAQPKSSRKGRMSMPSWDDIVFGAKADDD